MGRDEGKSFTSTRFTVGDRGELWGRRFETRREELGSAAFCLLSRGTGVTGYKSMLMIGDPRYSPRAEDPEQ